MFLTFDGVGVWFRYHSVHKKLFLVRVNTFLLEINGNHSLIYIVDISVHQDYSYMIHFINFTKFFN